MRILYCNCTHAEVVPPQVKRAVLERLSAAGVAYDVVPDLCELSARKDPGLRRIAESDDLRIAACYPRAVKWLFHAAGAPLADQRVKVVNMRVQSADQVVAGLLSDGPVPGTLKKGTGTSLCSPRFARLAPLGASPLFQRAESGGWIPWFPVIDYDRCTNCKQCLSFCLFGVFGLDANDRVEVVNPDHCKTGCPACARVCPSVAIMFPKHGKGPTNGDVVREEDVAREPVKVDVAALLGRDIHASLRARSRQAKERFSAAPCACGELSERLRQLKEMQAELGIPDEVMPILDSECACKRRAGGGKEKPGPRE